MPDISCRNCKFWSYDMDMDPFCVHPNASSMGTALAAMRGATKPLHARGEQCGPNARFFEQRGQA